MRYGRLIAVPTQPTRSGEFFLTGKCSSGAGTADGTMSVRASYARPHREPDAQRIRIHLDSRGKSRVVEMRQQIQNSHARARSIKPLDQECDLRWGFRWGFHANSTVSVRERRGCGRSMAF